MGGLVGALLVDFDLHSGSGNVDNIPSSLIDADAHLLVITKLMLEQETTNGEVTQGCAQGWTCDADSQSPLCTGSEISSPFNPFRIYSFQELSATAGSTMETNIVFANNSDNGNVNKNLDLVNGEYQPVIVLEQNSPSVLRIVHAAGGGPLPLIVVAESGASASSICEMVVIAWDGVYLDGRLVQEQVTVVAAARVEFEITCWETGIIGVEMIEKIYIIIFNCCN